jgi:hypothetical protein
MANRGTERLIWSGFATASVIGFPSRIAPIGHTSYSHQRDMMFPSHRHTLLRLGLTFDTVHCKIILTISGHDLNR